jgi:hypothetical protein
VAETRIGYCFTSKPVMLESYEVKSLQERLHTVQKQCERLRELLSQTILILRDADLDKYADSLQNAIDYVPEIP